MSKSRVQNILLWNTAHNALRLRPMTRQGIALTACDRQCAVNALILYSALLVDLDFLPTVQSAVRLAYRLVDTDIFWTVSTLKAFDSLLLSSYKSGPEHLMPAFKQLAVEKMWFLRPFTAQILRYERNHDEKSFMRLHQAFSFLGRLSLKNIDERPDVESFLKRNDTTPYVPKFIIRELNKVMRRWLKGFKVIPWGNHGPGTTADAGRVTREEKTMFLQYDACIRRAFLSSGYDPKDYYLFDDIQPPSFRWVRLTTVPKSALKRRCIAMETVSSQYCQQMVKASLYDWIDRHLPWIPLRDQGVNRKRAYEGSLSGYYSTLDLSAASDSVSWHLVKSIFTGTSILPWLYASRSRVVQYANRVYPLRMFATMGSALCFPIESIIFSGICEVAHKIAGCSRDYTCYGDDIICRTKDANYIISLLQLCGFTVNEEKSYFDDFPFTFRESCGGEYLSGIDVTPIRIPRRFAALKDRARHPETYLSWVQLANAATDRGFFELRSCLIARLLEERPFPAFGERTDQLHSYGPVNNFHIPKRWNRYLHKLEVKAAKLAVQQRQLTDTVPGELLELIQYWLWFVDKNRTPSLTTESFGRLSTAGESLRLDDAWIPAL